MSVQRFRSSSGKRSHLSAGSNRQPARARARRVRYAIVGLGHIAQVAVLPAFAHAQRNSELVALVSDDPTKRKELGRRYRIPQVVGYDNYNELLKSGEIDAVYIALPNSMHRDFTIRAARAGVHVLCEKPLAVTERECKHMIEACRRNNTKLMTAYRLHFEKSNLEAIRILRSGKLGELRYFSSIFSMQAQGPNIRLDKEMGGGPLHDLGIYCINAARYLFGAEPVELLAMSASGKDKRFKEIDEMVAATLRFPGERLASFTCSFGAADQATYDMVGEKGSLKLVNGYEYVAPIEMEVTIEGKQQSREFSKRDQFAPELIYFSDCILNDREPEPSGQEGLADVRVIEALYKSAATGKAVKLQPVSKAKRPSMKQETKRRPVREPELVHARSASGD